MLNALILLCTYCHQESQLASDEPAAVVILTSRGSGLLSDPKSKLFNEKYADQLSSLRKEPTNTKLNAFCSEYGYSEYIESKFVIVYPSDILGVQSLKAKTDVLTAFLNSDIRFDAAVNTSSKSSELAAGVKALVNLTHTSPMLTSQSVHSDWAVSFSCSILTLISDGDKPAKPKLVQFSPGFANAADSVVPVVPPPTEEGETEWARDSAMVARRDYLALYPAKDAYDGDLADLESKFWKEIAGRIAVGQAAIKVAQDRYMKKFCNEVLGVEPKDIANGKVAFSSLPESVQDRLRGPLAEQLRTSAAQSKADLGNLLKSTQIELRYFLPTLNLAVRSGDGLAVFGISAGQERHP